MVTLTPTQKEAVAKHLRRFLTYLQSGAGEQDEKERQQKIAFYQGLTRERVEDLDEVLLDEVFSHLWSTRWWTNRQWIVTRLLAQNELPMLRREFSELLFGEAPVPERYERFVQNVRGLGPAGVTEILCCIAPKETGIWNRRAREALGVLGFQDCLPLKKYQISREELELFNEVLHAIAAQMRNEGMTVDDLLYVDFFLYVISKGTEREQPPPPDHEEAFDHDEVREQVREIGLWLGFDADTEVTVAKGARVDVVWRASVGNLGVVTYVFEVQKSGSIDSLILNLQKATNNPTVQKVIAVSDGKQLDKVRGEVSALPESFRTALTCWRVAGVERAHQHLSAATLIISKLELVRDGFASR